MGPLIAAHPCATPLLRCRAERRAHSALEARTRRAVFDARANCSPAHGWRRFRAETCTYCHALAPKPISVFRVADAAPPLGAPTLVLTIGKSQRATRNGWGRRLNALPPQLADLEHAGFPTHARRAGVALRRTQNEASR